MTCLLFVLVLILFFSMDGDDRLDLEDIHRIFGSDDMSFTIDLPDNCTLRGEYIGNTFRKITSTGGKDSLCAKFEFNEGDNPNKFTDKLVRNDVADQLRRKLDDACKVMNKSDCTNRDTCSWIDDECVFQRSKMI